MAQGAELGCAGHIPPGGNNLDTQRTEEGQQNWHELGVNVGLWSPWHRQKGRWDKICQGFIFTLHSVADKVMGIVQPEPLDAFCC